MFQRNNWFDTRSENKNIRAPRHAYLPQYLQYKHGWVFDWKKKKIILKPKNIKQSNVRLNEYIGMFPVY